ncbi:MAG: N(2)-acetyl-L-2,4-diaminobutanoate deacetylase DoeB [Alphaproteobacteria bacterium]
MSEQILRPSPISASVDYDEDGVQHGFLSIPYSHDESAWGSIRMPICVIRNGDGPTALLTGGNHGDEYEGPIALYNLAASLDPATVTGRVIILPALNYPAFRAGRRTSPIDSGNMNRSFPGRPDGTITQKIADYVSRHLLPVADLVADIHSGGRTLEMTPFAAHHILPDKEHESRCRDAVMAFGAPFSIAMLELDAVGMLDTSVETLGKTFVTTELGGGGSSTPETVAVAKNGIHNILQHVGILEGSPKPADTTWLDMPDGDCFVVSDEEGLVEPCVSLGQDVKAGEIVARIHRIERTGTPPTDYRAKRDGILIGRHFPGRVTIGDCLGVLGMKV